MSYRDNCKICWESYHEDNLITCKICGRDFCYHCGSSSQAICRRCLDKALAEKSENLENNDNKPLPNKK